MEALKYPGTLATAFWDKQKAALAKLKPTTLRAELDKLNRCHDVVDWTKFSDQKLDTVAQADQRLLDLDKEAKSLNSRLATQADVVEKMAGKLDLEFKKDKQTPKEVLLAIGSVQKAAKLLQSDIDVYIETAKADINAARDKLEAKQKKDSKAPAAAAGQPTKASKFVRAKAIECLRKIKKPAPGAKPWRFIVVKGTPTVTVCLLQATPGGSHEKMLRSLIPGEKAQVLKDPKGEVIWEKNAMTLVSDRLPMGLAKKMQEWLKKLTKLNVKIRIRKSTGEVEESEDGEDIPDAMLKEDPAEAAAKAQAGKDFIKRLGSMTADIKRALGGPAGADVKGEIKELIDNISKYGKAQQFGDADEALDTLESLLEDAADASASPEAAAGGLSVKQLAAARLEWAQQRNHAVSEITRLARQMVNEFRNEPEQAAQVKKAVQQFQSLAGMLKNDLENQLDAALGENDPDKRIKLTATAKQTVKQIQALLDKDPLMRELDGNELIADMKVVAPMRTSLSAVEAALG